MKLVVQYKYMNCTVDKTKSTGSGHTNSLYYQLCCWYIINNIPILFISFFCKPLKTDPSGETCTCATWAKPFLPNAHSQNWFMHATAQLENFYYYMQGLIQKLRAAFGIGQKGHIFLKKGPQKIHHSLYNPFSKCFVSK